MLDGFFSRRLHNVLFQEYSTDYRDTTDYHNPNYRTMHPNRMEIRIKILTFPDTFTPPH